MLTQNLLLLSSAPHTGLSTEPSAAKQRETNLGWKLESNNYWQSGSDSGAVGLPAMLDILPLCGFNAKHLELAGELHLPRPPLQRFGSSGSLNALWSARLTS